MGYFSDQDVRDQEAGFFSHPPMVPTDMMVIGNEVMEDVVLVEVRGGWVIADEPQPIGKGLRRWGTYILFPGFWEALDAWVSGAPI